MIDAAVANEVGGEVAIAARFVRHELGPALSLTKDLTESGGMHVGDLG